MLASWNLVIRLFIIFSWTINIIKAEKSSDHLKVTCGSAIKLSHKETGTKLHSHDVKYGSGSGQQVFASYLLLNSWILEYYWIP